MRPFRGYSVANYPLRYTDPTGHWTFEEDPESSTPVQTLTPPTDEERIAAARAYRPSAPTMALPVEGSVTGPFGGHGSEYPAYNYKDKDGNLVPYYHPGQDRHADVGTPVRATKDGIVVAAGDFKKGYGWGVVIRHPGEGGAYTMNYHMQAESLFVSPGNVVLAGDPIGLSGDTPQPDTDAHLHWEIVQAGALTWDKDGMFHYPAGYYPLSKADLYATRISPSDWFKAK